jgi:hypothetical protein
MLFRYFIVEKLVVNVLSLTVGVPAELTAGNTATAKAPTSATDARVRADFNFIFSPTLQWHPNDADICDHFSNVQ